MTTCNEIESLDGFQNLDLCNDWQSHDPQFEWTFEELEQFRQDDLIAQQETLAMAGWWEMEGVRCATFGRDPNRNPYR